VEEMPLPKFKLKNLGLSKYFSLKYQLEIVISRFLSQIPNVINLKVAEEELHFTKILKLKE
jgi:hypothetical protein